MLDETKKIIDRLDKVKYLTGQDKSCSFGELKLETVKELEKLGYRIFRTRFYAPDKQTIQYEVAKPNEQQKLKLQLRECIKKVNRD